MDPGDVRVTFVSLALLHPPLQRFAGTQLPDLFAVLCDRHTFEGLEMTDDGARMYSDAREVMVRRDGLTIEEQAEVSFDLMKRNFADMADIVMRELNISVFVEPRVNLRALWPLREGDPGGDAAAVALLRSTVNLHDDQVALLGDVNLHGIGLDIEMTTEQDGGRHLSLAVGPHLADRTQLHLEITDWRHLQLETASVIEERMQESYDFLMKRAVPFVGSFAH